MNADELQVEAFVDEVFETELIAYSRLSRDALRQVSENLDAEEVPALSGPGDETEVLGTARVMIELYGTGAATHASHRARSKEDTVDSFSASIWRRVALTIEEIRHAANDPTSTTRSTSRNRRWGTALRPFRLVPTLA
jgi:hypothetical protein